MSINHWAAVHDEQSRSWALHVTLKHESSLEQDNAEVLAASPAYAALMERTLSKVVMVHVAALERLCQAQP